MNAGSRKYRNLSQGLGTVEASGPVPGKGLERESELIRSLSASSANMFREMDCLTKKKKRSRGHTSFRHSLIQELKYDMKSLSNL